MVRYLNQLGKGTFCSVPFFVRSETMNKYSLYKQRKFIKNVGAVCGMFRKHKLHMTLRELSEKTKTPTPTLSSFELGRSSSLRMVYIYLVSCETDEQAHLFMQYIVEVCLLNRSL